jgi:predicted dehydrogenase
MNVLIIGLGSIAAKHILSLRSLVPDVSIYALRSSYSASQEQGVTNVFDLQHLGFLPDFILIANPTIHHAATLAATVPLGVPLFIEKPSLHELALAPLLLAAIEEKKIPTYVACNLRFLEGFSFLKTYLDTHKPIINEVNVYAGSYLPDWRPGRDFRTIYSALPELGGGVHLDLVHELDYVYWLFGVPQRAEKNLRSVSSLHIKSIDYANYYFEYPDFSANIVLNYYRRQTKRTIEIVMADTTFIFDLLKHEIRDDSGVLIFQSNQKIIDTYTLQMTYFLNYIKGKDAAFNDFKTSIAVLEMASL